jgi:hypothetical protein
MSTFTAMCKCGAVVDGEWHPCPFAAEVEGDSETLCLCCEACTDACAEEV